MVLLGMGGRVPSARCGNAQTPREELKNGLCGLSHIKPHNFNDRHRHGFRHGNRYLGCVWLRTPSIALAALTSLDTQSGNVVQNGAYSAVMKHEQITMTFEFDAPDSPSEPLENLRMTLGPVTFPLTAREYKRIVQAIQAVKLPSYVDR
jgi:hypothetical protein